MSAGILAFIIFSAFALQVGLFALVGFNRRKREQQAIELRLINS